MRRSASRGVVSGMASVRSALPEPMRFAAASARAPVSGWTALPPYLESSTAISSEPATSS